MKNEACRLEIIEDYGPSPVSKRLEAVLREKAGDYAANRLLRDHRLPREEMTENERKLALIEFIEAMTDFLGKEEASEVLAEVGYSKRASGRAKRDRSPIREESEAL